MSYLAGREIMVTPQFSGCLSLMVSMPIGIGLAASYQVSPLAMNQCSAAGSTSWMSAARAHSNNSEIC